MLKENVDYRFTDGKLFINSADKWTNVNLDGYQFISIIAPGANGITVKAYHDITDRYVAVKVWKPRKSDYKKYKNQFLQEIQKLAKIKLPNIVVVHDGRVLDSGFCLAVFDYIDGITLKEWLTKEQFTGSYISVCKEILETVLKYQKLGILHGDLHGGNILISDNNSIHIIDFGTSIFSKENQSKNRECYFIADLTMALLCKLSGYDNNYFAFKINEKKQRLLLNKNILRCCTLEPQLLTETLLKYIDIVEMLTFLKSMEYLDMVDLCGFISHTRYLNIERLTLSVIQNYILDKQIKQFLGILTENVETNIFREVSDDDSYDDVLFQASAYVYYEIAKSMRLELSNTIEYDDEKEIIIQQIIEKLNTYIKSTDLNNYFEICNEIAFALNTQLAHIQNNMRAILYFSLKDAFPNQLYFLYYLNARISEILVNPELCSKIEKINEELYDFAHE